MLSDNKMSVSINAAKSDLEKVLNDKEDHISSLFKSTKVVDLSEKMFWLFMISDSMMDQFSSLDHSRIEPELQLRYFQRLVS